ncbi:dipeptide ABC transporter ATP-binding protein [Nesterenkonia alkaliphila]|uniref:Dipeptide ABC transporter ATP-binding protein n=1 Tax=Nesterenkonia alkaliphila TaxID=1463631 RepID=A0A7K1UGP1_9MICC|nr:ABC transporter ATP-binding protein [Nesterenkonia alkaliphila]MVT25546.1 dipeptide ABC transporter ATP-binding protein [Nesterenkonia alkaliphila]GFZ91000.1 ABC transporter permease [Nesterenkonia alkaliphila]
MTTSAIAPLLRVENLSVHAGRKQLVKDISFDIMPGERVGLIGESGSGKSLTCLSVLGLLDQGLNAQGRVILGSRRAAAEEESAESQSIDLLSADEDQFSKIRGNRLSMVFQEPMTALNPLMKVGDQLREVIRLHRPRTKQVKAEVIDLLSSVRIPEPARASEVYPHQMSGGQRQRVMLAMAMANGPELLVADEPTTALDVTVQKQVLNLMAEQVERAGSSLLFITHDLGVVSELCDRVIIMRQGRIVESGSIDRVFTTPEHPYTRALLAASALETHPSTGRLLTLESSVETGATALTKVKEAASEAARSSTGTTDFDMPSIDHLADSVDGTDLVYNQSQNPAIRVRDLTRTYGKPGLLGRGRQVEALRGVSFDVTAGQRFGIVGESGCGKSTLLRLLTALDEPTSGYVDVTGERISGGRERHLRWLRETMQIIFQDPMGSLDPRMKVTDIIAEPLRNTDRAERRRRVHELLEQVGLPRSSAEKHPHEFSGGQRQRIAIARALVTKPRVLVADEAVSALDVSVRAQVLNLLQDLVDEYQLTLVFVSHDLNVVRYSCDVVAVMHNGHMVECGHSEAVFDSPRHPYTADLVESIPRLRDRAA